MTHIKAPTHSAFEVYALLSSGTIEVDYRTRRFVAMGIPPGRRVEEETAGVVRLDLGSGRTEVLPRLDLRPSRTVVRGVR